METVESIHGRRSIRNYQPRSVPRDLIKQVLDDASQAPTPPVSGDRPFAFVVIEGAALIAEYGAAALRYAREHRKPSAAYNWVDQADFSVFFDAPVVVVICGFEDRHGQALQDCNRAGQNMMLSAYTRGLGTSWVGSPMLWLRDRSHVRRLPCRTAMRQRCHRPSQDRSRGSCGGRRTSMPSPE